jgi:hypothetical protein
LSAEKLIVEFRKEFIIAMLKVFKSCLLFLLALKELDPASKK